jgi:hypothetical protein
MRTLRRSRAPRRGRVPVSRCPRFRLQARRGRRDSEEMNTEQKVIKVKAGLLDLAKRVRSLCNDGRYH